MRALDRLDRRTPLLKPARERQGSTVATPGTVRIGPDISRRGPDLAVWASSQEVVLIGRYSRSTHLLARLEKANNLAQSRQRRDDTDVGYRPWRLKQRLDPVLVARLVDDYVRGAHTTELTKRYVLSKAGVLRLLREADIDMRRQGLSQEQTNEAIQLYESGLSLVRVGDRLGFGPSSVANALRTAGVTLRGRHDWRSTLPGLEDFRERDVI